MEPVGRQSARALEIGTRVGRFQIVRLLGRGGMGEVYLADDPTLRRQVALKVLAPAVVDDPERRAWFQREATSAAALNHPNICTIFEVGEDAGRAFIAMEAIEGRTLRALIADGPLPAERVVQIALQIAAALEHAQERHVVHRDLKSANILITTKGLLKVLDFGLAKRVLPDALSAGMATEWVSRNDLQIGTLPYMSPEQALARPVDHRSDLFSLGIVLYECLTGTTPFGGPSAPELMDAILHREPPPLDAAGRDIPAGLAAIVKRLLQKRPEHRYQSAHEVAGDLRTLQETGAVRVQQPRRRSRRPAAIAAALAIAAVASAWWGVQRLGQRPALATTFVVVPAAVTGATQFQYLTDAIPTSLTARLAEGGRLRMKMPPTTAEFAQVGGSLERVKDTYGVSACILPSAVVAGGRLTLTIQIVEPTSRDVLWTGEYQSPFERYGQALAQAAAGVRAALTRDKSPSVTRSDAAESSAIELAIGRGRYHAQKFSAQTRQEDFDAAEAAFDEALRLDPRSSIAAAERAYLQVNALSAGRPPEKFLPLVESWARRALDANSENGLAWGALAAAELFRPETDLPTLLNYGFRSAALGENCGRCQFGLIPVVARFSQVLKHHTAQRQAELEPLYANAIINSSVALAALGRADESTRALAQARAIDSQAIGVRVHTALIQGAIGAIQPAAAAAEALFAQGSPRGVPAWMPPMLDAVKQDARRDRELLSRTLAGMREAIQQRRLPAVGVQYLISLTVPMLARSGHLDRALDILIDAANADAPPPYDMLIMNPALRPLLNEPRAQELVVRSRAKFDVLLRAVDDARSAGRFPQYLEQPLQDVRAALRDAPATGRSGGSQ
jgi:tetratricopeptide (TPR) repeat protein